MVTYKIVLDERRAKPGGTYPIMIRVTSNRKTSNYYIGIAVSKEHWNAQASVVNNHCPNYRELNTTLTSKFLKAQKIILQMEEEGAFTFEVLKHRLNPQPRAKHHELMFKEYADKLISEMMEVKRTGNALVYQTAVNRLMAFHTNANLTFEQLDYAYVERFKHQLVKDGVKPNTIGNYLRSIRAIFNRAIKAKLVARGHYPFHDISIKTERTPKRAISVSDLQSIFKSDYNDNDPKWHARNYFILSFTLRGISFTDLAYLTELNVKGDVLCYKRKKTRAELTIKLVPLAKSIFSIYANGRGRYLLPIFNDSIEEGGLVAKAITRQWIKVTNKWLGQIATDCKVHAQITTYVTRHTWATTAKKLGYANELIAECLGHQYGNKITNIYLDSFEQCILDEVNEKVVGVMTFG